VAEHRRRLPQARLFNEYGPTEATVWATVHELGREDEAGPVPIGRPIPGVRLEVVDAAGRRVPAGVPGHAWIAGPTVARGYWRRPDQTVERFVPSPSAEQTDRYRTGDLLAWTPEGRLTFHGREDEQIKLRGYRIEPGEIEAVLLEHPAIEEAAVVARGLGAQSVGSSAVEATSLVAFVRIRGPVEEPEWRQRLEGRLPRHLIPSRVVSLPALPVLPNGKVDRRLLQGMRLDPQVGGVEQPQAATVVEQALIALWEGLLHRTGIGPTDNFFELGGHSLLVVEMVLAIERHFEVSLSPAEVFQRPTVRELGQRIEQQRGADMPSYRHLFPIQVSGSGRPFIIAVPHFFSGMFAARFRGERPVYGLRGVSLRAEGNYGRWPTMAALGDELVQEIERRFPRGPCILAGYSFGASMAYEAARVLEAQGLPAALLVLITPMPLNFFRLGPFTLQIDGLCRPVTDLSAADALRLYARHNHPLTWAPYRRARRRLVTEPWRRALCLTGQLRARAGLPLTPRILHADVRVERFRLHAGYRPEPIQTPTLFFNAAGAKTDAAATWRPCFRGPIEVVETPDPHDEESLHAARQVILHHLRRLEDR
jgi:acyl carrier protein